jgi:hypothetical protein
MQYIDVDFYRNSPQAVEGWGDNFWMGPADQFNANLHGNEGFFATLGKYNMTQKLPIPLMLAQGTTPIDIRIFKFLSAASL